jgi:hypothetical protein
MTKTKSKPFYRANALFLAISALMGAYSGVALQTKLAELAPYKSRGKGKGLPGKNFRDCGRSRYVPHQGAKECARRAEQLLTPKVAK